MNNNNHRGSGCGLNLDAIKEKLMHVESGEGWSSSQVESVEREYRRFLELMKLFPNEQASPSVEVDTFWHYHILDTRKYAADCEQFFGYFLHHYPYVGIHGEDAAEMHRKAGERMRELYAQVYGVDDMQATFASQAFCGAQTAFCGAQTQAFCGAQASAFCGPTTGAAHTAFCGAASEAASNAAFCGAASTASGPAAPEASAISTKHAFCGASQPRAAFAPALPMTARPASCGAAAAA